MTTDVAPRGLDALPAQEAWRHSFAVRSVTALTLAALAVATVALRLPFMAPRLAHWDAVNYALGLHTFDIAAHQPHPPGSPYFILLGRAGLALVGDDNLALELVSLTASSVAVLLEFFLARLLFRSTRAALLSAALLMTQPIFWGYGTTASAWTVLALCACAIASASLLLLRGHARLVYASALLVGVVSGFRADAAVFLAPLWLWSLFRATTSWRSRVLAVVIACAAALVWLIPVAMNAGGAVLWWDRLLALLPADDLRTPRQLAANTAIAFGTLGVVLGPAVLVSVLSRRRLAIERRTAVFLALWSVPAFTFLWLVDSTEPGHDLVFAGALAVLGAAMLGRSLAYGAIVVALQAAIFLFAAPLTDRPLAWTLDSMLLNVTAPGIRQQQASLEEALQTVRGFDPAQTEVITLVGQDPYRFVMYYLPEYTVVRLDPAHRSVLTARGGAQGNWTEAPCLSVPQNVVWVLSTPTEPGTIPPGATRLSEDDGPFQVWYPPARAHEYLGFTLRETCTPRG